ncbi:MAG TPA: LLM class flavin-dependent oxidoreductase [Sphingomonadaceae bacterium]|nr:LLM class flavin-dependent oxidoreductase [Sphingomonadaceae bacterium]
MKIFVFDLVHYGKNLQHLSEEGYLPLLGKSHCDPKIAASTYADHLDAWEEMDRLGYDGIAFNEHHATPYGLMNSPNLLAASAAQRTKNVKLLIYGNLLPLHNPLRLAEEIAMLDCLSGGRIICGIARGAAREYRFFNVPMSESRARFEEAYAIMTGAWTREIFAYDGQFNSYRDLAIWPRPVQQPHPPVWMPVTGSQESIEFAARNNIPITPGIGGAAREDILRHYGRIQAEHGRKVTPDHITIQMDCYVADSYERAVEEYSAYSDYFSMLFNYDYVGRAKMEGYYSKNAYAYLRPELRAEVKGGRDSFAANQQNQTLSRLGRGAWGSAEEVADRIIESAEHAGAGTVMVTFNRGALPQEMYLHQVRRFAAEVMPRLKAHQVARVPFAESEPA